MPDRLPMFLKHKAKRFCLLITPSLANKIDIKECKNYETYQIRLLPKDTTIDKFIVDIEDDTDIFFIPYQYPALDCYPTDGSLKPNQRFVDLLVNQQTIVDFQTLIFVLNSTYNLSNKEFKQRANLFFKALNRAESIDLINPIYDAKARIILQDYYLWTESIGQILKNESIRAPCGEIALTSMHFRDEVIHNLSIDGQIVFDSTVILHLLKFEDTLFKEQERIYDGLSKVKKAPIKLVINKGIVVDIIPLTQDKEPAQILEDFFSYDTELRKIIEMGFGLNKNLQLLPQNLAANEAYGGLNNCLHVGFGRRKLKFHLDMLSPHTCAITNEGVLLAGYFFNPKR
ncbi:hypothetical protein [Legionella gresilensis]|uniref:hypothetical protein n=1 Tax=Legionella gresilensis TaxID=91823 RepID=UPI001041AB69|nr:hypothetical protein [Legionella gresilensis]